MRLGPGGKMERAEKPSPSRQGGQRGRGPAGAELPSSWREKMRSLKSGERGWDQVREGQAPPASFQQPPDGHPLPRPTSLGHSSSASSATGSPEQAKHPPDSPIISSPDPYSHGRPLNPGLHIWKLRLREANDLPEVTQGMMEPALHPKTPTTSLNLEQEAKCGPGLTGSKEPGGPQDESQHPHPNQGSPSFCLNRPLSCLSAAGLHDTILL